MENHWKMTFYFLTEIQTIMDKSLGTNLHLWRFYTRAKQIHLRLFIPSPSPPSYNVGHVYKLFLQSFNIVLGEGGRRQHILKRITVLFENSILKTPKINAITQVSQGILSTIVWISRLIVKCTITMVFSLKCVWDLRLWTCELRKAFLRTSTRLSRIFWTVLDPPGKVLISHNIESFVGDGSGNGVAWFVTNCQHICTVLQILQYLNGKSGI